MASLFRAPVRIEIQPRKPPHAPPGPNLLTDTLARGAVPFGQTEWPNPVLRRRPEHNFTWLAEPLTTTLILPNPKPFLVSDWQNPLLKRQPNEHLSYIYECFELLTAAIAAPFPAVDLSNPIRHRYRVVPHHHRETRPGPVVTPVTDPFIPMAFPNPQRRVPFFHPNVSRVLDNVIEVDPSTLSHDWTNPILRPWQLQPFVIEQPINYTLAGTVTLPFMQTDWPNPLRRVRSVNGLSEWAVMLNTTLALGNQKPFMQTEFPNPLPTRYPHQKAFEHNVLFIVSPPAPKQLVIRKTLAAMGTRVLSRQKHLQGDS